MMFSKGLGAVGGTRTINFMVLNRNIKRTLKDLRLTEVSLQRNASLRVIGRGQEVTDPLWGVAFWQA